MDKQTILSRFERLPYDERMKNLVQIGRESINNPHSRSLITDLSTGSPYCPYEQLLAIETCFGSRDMSVAFKVLNGSSKHLKKRAMAVITMFGTSDDVLMALKSQLSYLQDWALRRMRNTKKKRRRLDVVDAFLEELKAQDRSRFRTFLPFASTELVERHLAEELDSFTASDWSRLAIYHHYITLREIKAWTDRLNEEDVRLLGTANVVITLWAEREMTVDRAVDVLETMLKVFPWGKPAVPDALIYKRPRAVVELLLTAKGDEASQFVYSYRGVAKSRRFVAPIPTDQLLKMHERCPHLFSGNNFPFEVFTPEQRNVMYNVVKGTWRSTSGWAEGVIPINILSHLQETQRISEARRHMNLKFFETRPADKIPYISMLPWEEAMELQASYLKSNDANIRSSALQWQIMAANYEAARIDDAVQLVVQRQYEQDLVRRKMMEALTKLAPSRWDEHHHLPSLEKALYHALDAVDLSIWTVQAMLLLIIRILPFHPHWAAAQLVHTLKRRNYTDWNFQVNISGEFRSGWVMDPVAHEMAPTLKYLLVKKNVPALASIAEAFESNLWGELRDALETSFGFEYDPAHSRILRIMNNDRRGKHIWPNLIPARCTRDCPPGGHQRP